MVPGTTSSPAGISEWAGYTDYCRSLTRLWTNKGQGHLGSQVPSPNMVAKSQHGGKVPNFEPQENTKIGLNIIEVGS